MNTVEVDGLAVWTRASVVQSKFSAPQLSSRLTLLKADREERLYCSMSCTHLRRERECLRVAMVAEEHA
jgi:hypothetical protein